MGEYRPYYPNPDAVVYPKSVPYQGHIPGGIHDGKLIEIRGTVPYGADSFSINLCTGHDTYCDRAFHLSARFHGHIVVRNSRERGEWAEEERDGPFPFHSGREFTIMIMVETLCYKVAVNCEHAYEFYHRIPMDRVSSLLIEGSVQIERIEFIDKISPYQPGYPSGLTTGVSPGYVPGFNPSNPTSYPGTGTCIIPPPEQHITPGYVPRNDLAPIYNPPIPYSYPIYGGLRPGMMIYISGRPSASAYNFVINLQSGTAPYPPPDILFHFSARFNTQTLVRNSRVNDCWENEETSLPYFPFQPAVNFDLVIRVEVDKFMVALDGRHLFEFRHRLMPLDRFDTLSIEHDIVVSSIRFS